MASITLKNVYKIYPGDVTAVDNFNLEIADREFLILVGPSGCGKSTTLRMIAGLEDISKGELYIGDKLVNDVLPKDRDIAMVFQNYALYPHMTVYKNMAFGLKMRKVPKDQIKAKVYEVAKMLDIEQYLQRKPKALSGGQRQRVALGRAMVRDPKAFLLDEPLSNLDAKLRTAMRAEIAQLHKKLGTTFVYVTHDQTEAMTMGDRIVVMKDGFIQQVDTPQNLYDKPSNLFVAGFIGTPQMNFMNATIRKTDNGFVAVFCESVLPLFPKSAKPKGIASYVGKEVTLGIRPEDLHVGKSDIENPEMGVIDTELDFSELLGSETYLYLIANDIKFIAKVSSSFNSKKSERIKIAINCKKMHIFDKETGKTISHEV